MHFSKIHDTKFSILTILSVEFSRVHYIHFATNLYNPSCLPKLKLSPLDNNSPASSPPQPLQTTDLLSVSVNLTPLGTSHE